MDDKDRVIASEVVRKEGDLLVVAAKGLGKRTAMSQFPRQNRGGKGVTAMKRTSRTGPIVAAGMVHAGHTVLMMSTSGIVIRIPAAQIRTIGRATQGVTLMRLAGNEQVASMTIVDPVDEEASNGRDAHVLPPIASNGASAVNGAGGAKDSNGTAMS